MLRHPGPSRGGKIAAERTGHGSERLTRDAAYPERLLRTPPSARFPTTRATGQLGGIYAFTAYFLWGFLPLYFLLLAPDRAVEIVAWRILLSLAFCAILLTVTRTWGKLVAISCTATTLVWTIVAGAADLRQLADLPHRALSGHVIETSLGYFINPIVTVCSAVLVLRERLRAQWIALGIATVAVLVIVVGYRVPMDRADARLLLRPPTAWSRRSWARPSTP